MEPASPLPRDRVYRRRHNGQLVRPFLAALLCGSFLLSASGRTAWFPAAVMLILAVVVAELLTRQVSVRDGELVVRRKFRTHRVSLRTLSDLRAEAVESRDGRTRPGHTRYRVTDVDGRSITMLAHDVQESAQLARTLAWWAEKRDLTLEPATAALLLFQCEGGARGFLRTAVGMAWETYRKSARR